MFTYPNLPAHFIDGQYHRRCGVHVQTLLLYHEPITILIGVLAISIGIVLLTYPNLHHKTSLYQQLFRHYARVKANNYLFFYRIAITTWITVHIIHMITVGTTILATQLIRPQLLYPQLVLLIISMGFYTFAILSIITMNILGSNIIWISALFASFFYFFTITNLYLIVLTHRYVFDRREALQKILSYTKTVTFKENQSTTKQMEQQN